MPERNRAASAFSRRTCAGRGTWWLVDEDTEAAAWHQVEQEQREREERCRRLQRELIDETKVFEENNRSFWQRIRSIERA